MQIKGKSLKELDELSSKIRERIIDVVSRKGAMNTNNNSSMVKRANSMQPHTYLTNDTSKKVIDKKNAAIAK